MQKIFISIFSIILFISPAHAETKTSLQGKITDKKTGASLQGVSVSIPDLSTGTTTDSLGFYIINNLPMSNELLDISLVGYSTITVTIDLSTTLIKDFQMESMAVDLGSFTITGSIAPVEIKMNPVPVVAITKKDIIQNLSSNAIDIIAKLPGVNAVTTGPNVSKPFIRGLGFNRVLTLYDGVRMEGQQWGDEHGVEVDQSGVERVEVVKGPSSLIYGSDAVAGVVNLIPAAPLPLGKISGDFLLNAQSNNGMFGSSFGLAGNENGFVWGTRISIKEATNYQNKIDGRVYGTAFQEKDLNAYIGLNKDWGFSHLRFSAFNDLQSIPDGSRDSLTRKFTKQITESDTIRPIVSDDELNSYTIPVLHQHVQHYQIVSANNFYLWKGKLGVTLGYQQSIRQEFAHPENPDISGLDLVLNSFTYDLKYNFPQVKKWDFAIGLNGMHQTNTNRGTEFIIPDYTEFDAGPFAFVKKSFKHFDVSAGIRYDNKTFDNKGMYVGTNLQTGFSEQVNAADTTGAEHVFQNYRHTFSGISGSAGISYNVTEKIIVKGNIARGFRSPNIAEISANGIHPGDNIYQIGNTDFKPELSLQEDLGIDFTTKDVTGEAEIFNNRIANYIFNQKIITASGNDSIIVPGFQTFKFEQAAAQLYGAEIGISIHPAKISWLTFDNSVSLIYAFNKGTNGVVVSDSAKYLPFIPPMHTNSSLHFDVKKLPLRGRLATDHIKNVYAKIEMEYYTAQNHVYLAYNTETPTAGYTLFNAGIGADVVNKKGKVLFNIGLLGSNLTDVAYQAHLSRLKYFEPYTNSTSGHSGIYNMGRNICLKITVPIEVKK